MNDNMNQDYNDLELVLADLENDEYQIRCQAITWLGKHQQQKAISHLVSLLHDGDWNIRAVAAHALGEIGDRQTVPNLIEALEQGLRDESQLLAECTIEALGKIGDPAAVDGLIKALHPAHLIEKVNLANKTYTPNVSSYLFTGRLFFDVSDIRCSAVEALAQIGDERAVTSLIQALNDPYDQHLQKAATQALEGIATPEAIAALENR